MNAITCCTFLHFVFIFLALLLIVLTKCTSLPHPHIGARMIQWSSKIITIKKHSVYCFVSKNNNDCLYCYCARVPFTYLLYSEERLTTRENKDTQKFWLLHRLNFTIKIIISTKKLSTRRSVDKDDRSALYLGQIHFDWKYRSKYKMTGNF